MKNERPSTNVLRKESPELRNLVRDWSKLEIKADGILHRSKIPSVLPKSYHPLVLKELHKEMGHLGTERTVNLIRDHFLWPKMQYDVEHFVTNASECLKKRKPNRTTRAPMMSIKTTHPFELVSVDFLHLEKSKGGYEYILVVIDHYTRFAHAYRNRKTDWKNYLPKVLHAYNCTSSDATGYSPFFLLFGRPPWLPVYILFGIEREDQPGSYQIYVEKLR
ncbi:Pro-Pol polyprotein [Merluccius polli]|uniref:Gypsy retrotransposon integrase-like protein 1 n=1 Tax=Merluccius polli TaxID=89951 RepID=A0AA47M8E6_MERPO|nr:Pro-Pol polyprotein [Merluccius polli]